MIFVILAPSLRLRCFRFDHDKSKSCAMAEIKLKYAINMICWIEEWFQPTKKNPQVIKTYPYKLF